MPLLVLLVLLAGCTAPTVSADAAEERCGDHQHLATWREGDWDRQRVDVEVALIERGFVWGAEAHVARIDVDGDTHRLPGHDAGMVETQGHPEQVVFCGEPATGAVA